MIRSRCFSYLLFCYAVILSCGDTSFVDYNTEVKPILNKKCLSCHGGVKASGGFNLLTRDLALRDTEAGKPAIIPGNAARSEMIKRLSHEDPELRMPLGGEPLTTDELEILTKWIDQDLPWGLHWSYQSISQEPTLPQGILLGSVDAEESRLTLDAFVQNQLKENGIEGLSPRADDTTLLRRASLDLIGMPAPRNIGDSFLSGDMSYEVLLDSLMAQKSYGEKWTSMWLDIARYADSKGYERDPHRDIWQYRDWVIRAFNRDQPYDKFLIDQLAGDLLPNPTDDQLLATAFHRNTSTNDEGGTDNEEYRTYAVIDRVNTTWEGIMGTTFACVQCHSHPYDPIMHEEYYEFMAFFNNTRDADTAPDYPLLRSMTAEDSTELVKLLGWAAQQTDSAEVQSLKRFIKTWQPVYYGIETDSLINAALYDTKDLGLRQNGSSLLRGVDLTDANAVYFRSKVTEEGGKLKITTASKEEVLTIQLPKTDGWEILRFPMDPIEGQHTVHFSYTNSSLKDQKTAGIMIDWFGFRNDPFPWDKEENDAWRELYKDLLSKDLPTTPIMIENPKTMRRQTHVFDRGNWMVEKQQVSAGVPEVFDHVTESNTLTDRLDLAYWMTDTLHPLTSRTIVNRLWEQLFGQGIVKTGEDFGSQGTPPSHPELLDWLSWQLMHTHDWHLKSFLKMIMTSGTYQQQSIASPNRLEKDPENKFLSRGPRVRLTAEQIRDQALMVSGLLNSEMYGPSVMPFQPTKWTTPYSNEHWIQSTDGQQYRRAVYTYWKRSSPYPAMMIFDAAERSVCEARRIRTNTPLHALVTLNDPVYFEAASHLAKLMKKESESLTDQIRYGYQKAIGHGASTAELSILEELFENSIEKIRTGGSDARSLTKFAKDEEEEFAALIVVANTIMNMDEFIMKN